MSDKKRIYLSGYVKRKLKKEAEDAVSKLPKLTNLKKKLSIVKTK
jgi:N12 class adenine-specific DNA methylase